VNLVAVGGSGGGGAGGSGAGYSGGSGGGAGGGGGSGNLIWIVATNVSYSYAPGGFISAGSFISPVWTPADFLPVADCGDYTLRVVPSAWD